MAWQRQFDVSGRWDAIHLAAWRLI